MFQTLRANDLIWPYVVNNYLKGKSPAAFDLLYWNADATNLPGPMYAWYLRNMYLENNLCVPNRLTICEEPVDLGQIDMPSYVLATQEDHIVPWRSAYRTTQLVGGKTAVRAGRQRPHRRRHQPGIEEQAQLLGRRQAGRGCRRMAGQRRGEAGQLVDPLDGVAQAPSGQGRFRRARGSAMRAFKPIEPAPGRYVKVRAD